MSKLLVILATFFLPYMFATPAQKSAKEKGKIQIALLLDTSNSMDGLIDQAKSQLWKMVNKLASAKKNGEYTELEIALFEYGNDNLALGEGYVRIVSPLTTDVDGISERLFSLKTNGGSEYCGWVIANGVNDLKWSDKKEDLHLIIIAGNESFEQGPKDFRTSCQMAKAKDIVINTIFCGAWKTGIELLWKEGAACAKGEYLNIDQDKQIIHIRTPYDDKMIELNRLLNDTYLGYGTSGSMMKERQMIQDSNAGTYGLANAASRTAYKAKAQYRNEDWDVVDAADKDIDKVINMDKAALPEAMKNMTVVERKTFIEQLRAKRIALRKEIQALEKDIQTYTAEEMKKTTEVQTLDKAMEGVVVKQAIEKQFIFEEK